MSRRPNMRLEADWRGVIGIAIIGGLVGFALVNFILECLS